MSMLLFTGCKKDDPVIPNEEEVITTLNYTLIPSDGGTPVVLSFQDLDGDGGDPPVITGGTLAMNTTYNGSLELLNETETPPGDITEEVEEEADEHQFFFQGLYILFLGNQKWIVHLGNVVKFYVFFYHQSFYTTHVH